METHKTPLFDLFRRERQYRVPLFQRPYVWSLERQWEPLWEDVIDRARAILDLQASGKRGVVPGNHFLGAIVTRHVDVFGQQIDSAEIIDGQQRLTTMQIVLKAFFDYVNGVDEASRAALSRVASDVGTLTRNSGVMAAESETYKVWPTNADRDVFRRVLEAGSADAVKSAFPQMKRKWQRRFDPRPRLAEAYLYFFEAVSTFCTETGDGATAGLVPRANALYEALRRHLLLVHIELQEDDDPQVIFESLNGRGEPLLPSDLIRNFVFMRAGSEGKNVESLYAAGWKEYDERKADADAQGEDRFWKQMERQGRLRRPRLDLFVYHYLQCQVGDEFSIGHLYQTFRSWWDRPVEPRDVERELARLRAHGDVFADLSAPEGGSAVAAFARRLKVVDTSTVYPALLYLLVGAGDRVERSDVAGILVDIESYLVRRLICDLTTKSYNKTFLALLKRMLSAKRIDRSLVQGFLLEGTGPAVSWPDDDAFRDAWLQRPVYEEMKSHRVSMVLQALNAAMHTAKQEPLEFRGRLTVEHVLPVRWQTAAWPLPSLSAGRDPEAKPPDVVRNRLLHSFGNLTLLTQELNSGVSNGPYDQKRKEIGDQSLIRLNAWFRETPNWDEGRIVERGKALFEIARTVWARP